MELLEVVIDMRIMSFNLRFDNPEDGENSWGNRKPAVKEILNDADPDILGIQEGLPHQVEIISEWFKNYNYFGRGRAEGGSGEQVAVFYKKERFKCLDHGHFWLSDTPEIPGSKSFGNQVVRMASWVILYDRFDDKEFLFLNTHLDHNSLNARIKGAELISSFCGKAEVKYKIVTGDFNDLPESKAISILKDEAKLVDLFNNSSNQSATFHNFSEQEFSRIDYIFVSDNIKSEKIKIIKEKPFDIYPSDHYPIYADLRLE